jgi:histidine ammonia-lyase
MQTFAEFWHLNNQPMDYSHYISSEVLSLETINQIIFEHKTLALSEEAKVNIQKCRDYLDQKMKTHAAPIYGINTGFGSLCNVKISNENLSQLQEN